MPTIHETPSQHPYMYEQRLERRYSAHNDLLRISRRELEKAAPPGPGWWNVTATISQQPGWWDHAFVSLVCSALAVEALGNAFGERIVPSWKDKHERFSPFDKMRFLAKRLGVPHFRDVEPWTTLRWLCSLRNDVAHAKPEDIETTTLITAVDHVRQLRAAPESKLESQISIEAAQSALHVVEGLRQAFWERLDHDDDDYSGLLSDGWSGHTSPHVPASGAHG